MTVDVEKRLEIKQREYWPLVVNEPYPYMPLVDLEDVLVRIAPAIDREVVRELENGLLAVLSEVAEGWTFLPIPMKEVNEVLETRLELETERLDKKVAIVNLDRYLGTGIVGQGWYRLEMSRGVGGGLVARPGADISPEEQIKKLIVDIGAKDYEEVIVTDDVLAFGDTMVPLLARLKEELPRIKWRLMVGLASSGEAWSGIERIEKELGIEPEYLILAKPSPADGVTLGMAIPAVRDFTFLGGKVGDNGEGLVPFSFPYFLPFSVPVASIMSEERRETVSKKLMEFNLGLVEVLSYYLGRELTVGDVVESGFGLPFTNINDWQEQIDFPDADTTMRDYLLVMASLMISR